MITPVHGDFRIYIHDRDLVMECACGWRCGIRTLQSGDSLETYISGEEIRAAVAEHERETRG